LDIPPQTAHFPEGAAAAIGLTLLPLPALPRPLPSGFTGIVAAEIDSPGLTFTTPARLTLPTVGQLSPGDLLVLLCLDEATGTYTPLGLGRVSGEGTVIESLSGGVRHACTVVYARTGPDGTKVFLLPVSGNQQQAEPGEELPEPLVVRLEDQFGNPISNELLAADILQGVGDILEPDLITDAQGQAAIRVQVGQSEEDLIVQVRPPDLPRTRPVHFFSIVGELNTADVPRDLAIADDDILLVADTRTGLLVLDIRNPTQPVHLHTLPPSDAVGTLGNESVWSVIVHQSWAYLGIGFAAQLYVVDLTDPRHPDFTTDTDGDGTANVIRAILDLPGDVRGHAITDLVVRGPLVYALSNAFSDTLASLYIVDVQEPTQPQLVHTVMLPTGNPTGMALAHDFLYVAAETAGLLTFDLSDPTRPTLVHTLGDPNPQDDLDITLTSDIATEGDRLYVVETQGQTTDEPRDHLVVMDLSPPSQPRRQGRVPITVKPQLSLFSRGLAVAPPFAYVARGFFGLEALDIRDPEAPRHVGFVTTPSEALQVTASNELVYVTDQIFGLQVIQGPGATEGDTDGDGIVDFFDAFPTDPLETQDTDGDRLGNHTDDDDDNDSFSDAEEAAARPPTDPLDPLSVPIRVPPPGVRTMVVDATSPQLPRERIGTAEAPYRSVTEAIRAVRSGLAPDVETVQLRPGTYSPLLTQEVIPLDLGRLSTLTLQAASPGTVVLDGEFRGDVINAEFSHDLLLEGLAIKRGAHGISVRESTNVTLRNNHCFENTEDGIRIGLNANTNIVVADNLVEANGEYGIFVAGNAAATITRNTTRFNDQNGILVLVDSTADITDNLSERNGESGIAVAANSSATISRNVSQHNSGATGIGVFGNSTATIIQNTSSFNLTGIVVDLESIADIRNNTTTDSIQTNERNGNGILIAGGSEATINGGLIARNQRHGIMVRVSPFMPEPMPGTARIGLDSTTVLEISDNGGAGLFVADDGSSAEIDSRNLVFRHNAGGDMIGDVTDVAP
jgi:parallel beta-helix repeat protein